MINDIRIIKVIGLLILCVLLAEAILWITFPIPIDKEDCRIKFVQDIPGLKKNILYERNKFGLRSLSMATKRKPKDTIRIICIGASTTDQPVQNTEDTWPGVLEKMLQRAFEAEGVKIEVASYGRGGHVIMNSLSLARKNSLDFQPDIVITLGGTNDLCWRSGVPQKKGKLSLKTQFLRYSQICRRLRIFKRKLYGLRPVTLEKELSWSNKNLPRLRKKYKFLPYVENPVRDPDPIGEFTESTSKFFEFLTKSKIDVIALGQPTLWKKCMTEKEKDTLWFPVRTPDGPVRPGTTWLESEMCRYNEVEKRIAERFGATYIDLDRHIPKTLQFFFDDCHFTDIGNEAIALRIFPVVSERVRALVGKD